MRALIFVTILGLAGFASAAIGNCAATVTNGALCTDTSFTQNGVTFATGNPVTCATGFFVQSNAAKTATSCVAVGNGCSQNAPNVAGATTPPLYTCAVGQNTPTSATGTDAAVAPTATATQAVCNNPATVDATKTYYTPSSLASGTSAPFSATPQNTWQCYACPTGCVDCTPAATKTPNAASPQLGCKTAGSGYYVNGGTTADTTSGLFAIATCPTAVNATYGNNATAASCTACNPVVSGAQTYGNCTVAACGTGYTYVSIANTTGLGNQTIGGKSVNLSAVPYTNSGPYIGCYNSDNLLALITAAQAAAANNTNGSTSSASRITAGIAVASAVAAVFAF